VTYRIIGRIGGGGFSEVFEVQDPASALPERLVLKRLSPELSSDPRVRAAFSDEARILRELKHPNVVSFRRCYYDTAGRVCLLMEKVDGRDLAAWAAEHRDDPVLVLEAFSRLLAAVDYLHHRPRPYLHLDLKPENLLIRDTASGPCPVLIDFGIARSLGGRGLKAYTPPYGAPEQERGSALGCFTDVYSLGQILRELVDLLAHRLQPEARQAFAGLVARCTHPSRGKRPQDAGEMLRQFRRARVSVEATAAGRTSPEEVGRRGSGQAGLQAAGWSAVALGGALLLVVVMVLWPEHREVSRSPAGRQSSDRAVSSSGSMQAGDALREIERELAAAEEGWSKGSGPHEVDQHVRRVKLLMERTDIRPEARAELERRLARLRGGPYVP
jgi:serine/threonine protein kinase